MEVSFEDASKPNTKLERDPIMTCDQQLDRSRHVVDGRINYVVVDKLSFLSIFLWIVAIAYNIYFFVDNCREIVQTVVNY